ncbi:uncharacterized protein LOC113146861 [Cyclospora cayetanensis]|uniref:Spindle pole body component n=1 Tax=Cyclospora cayetanensis TaxID=88456 RepID=A0A6P6RTU4_9EIME|nr:uncharacterized protein LOC113146861 [Cyclospora cayetanensis]
MGKKGSSAPQRRSVKPPEGYSEGALCIKFGSRAPAEWLGASLGALLQRPLLLQEALATRALLMLVLGDGSLERLLHQIKQLLLLGATHAVQEFRQSLQERLQQHAGEGWRTAAAPAAAKAKSGGDAANAASERALCKDVERLLHGALLSFTAGSSATGEPEEEEQQQQLLYFACSLRHEAALPTEVLPLSGSAAETDAAAAAAQLMGRLQMLPSASPPLQSFLPPLVSERYAAILRFALQMDAALQALSECWMLRRRQQQLQRFAAKAAQLQQRMQHFLRAVWEFVWTEAIESEWTVFSEHVTTAAAATESTPTAAAAAEQGNYRLSYFALVEAHARCADNIYTRCLLAPRLAPLHKKLVAIMQCAWRLKALLTQYYQHQQLLEQQQQQPQQHMHQGSIVRASLSRCLSLAAASSPPPLGASSSSSPSSSTEAEAAAARELGCLAFDFERNSSAFIRALFVLQPLQILSPLLLRLTFNGALPEQIWGVCVWTGLPAGQTLHPLASLLSTSPPLLGEHCKSLLPFPVLAAAVAAPVCCARGERGPESPSRGAAKRSRLACKARQKAVYLAVLARELNSWFAIERN